MAFETDVTGWHWDRQMAEEIIEHGRRVKGVDCPDPDHNELYLKAVQFLNKEDHQSSVSDIINHPPHYNAHPSGVECITVVEHMNFNVGNAIKYLWRADHKNGLEDLKKAAWYVQREISRLERTSNGS